MTAAVTTSELRELVEPLTPTASLYLGLDPSAGGGRLGRDREQRWRTLAAQLTEQGADQSTVDVLGEYVLDAPAFPAEYAFFARGGEVVWSHRIPGGARLPIWRDRHDLARFDHLASIAPLLAWRQRRPAHLRVVIDRTGAEVTAVPEGTLSGEVTVVDGPDDEIERNAPGGWSQARYQRRAEDSWEHNAAAVAEAVGRVWEDLGGSLLLIAGDVRAVQLLEERLPEAVRQTATIRHVPGGRSPDGSDSARAAAIEEALIEYGRMTTASMLREDLPAGLVHNGAVQGVTDTVNALAIGRVRTLLFVVDPDDERRAWCGERLLCAPDGADVTADPVADLRPGRLIDVALRAALMTDAGVHLLPADPEEQPDAPMPVEGIGALCRF